MNRRDFLKTTAGLAAIALIPTKAQADPRAFFHYFTQPKNITNINTQLPAKTGLELIRSGGGDPQTKITGNYRTEETPPEKDRATLMTEMGMVRGSFQFDYSFWHHADRGVKVTSIMPYVSREDAANIRVYFATNAEIKGATQVVEVVTHKTEKMHELYAAPLEKTEIGKALKAYNEKANAESDTGGKLERATDEAIEQLGGTTGVVLKAIKWGTKQALKRREAKDIAAIRKKHGNNIPIYQMQFHQPNGNPFKHTIVGRATRILIDQEKEAGKKIHIIIPQLSFVRDIQGITWRSTINGLAYEFTIPKPEKKN